MVGHELGHFNSYDAKTESTAKRVEDAIQGTKNKGKYTEKLEKEFQEKYAGRDISGSEAQKAIDDIPEGSRENVTVGITGGVSASYGIKGGIGFTKYLIVNTDDFKKSKTVLTFDKSIGLGTPDAAIGGGIVLLYANTPEELKGWVKSAGGSGGFLGKGGFDTIINTENVPIGIRVSAAVAVAPGEVHSQFDHSSILTISELNLSPAAIKKAIILESEYKRDPTNPELIELTKEFIEELEKN